MVEHHARRLGGLARRVRNVKALDREGIEVLFAQVQRLGEGPGTRLLRTLFGQQAGQLDVCIF